MHDTGEAGASMVLRDDKGEVVFTACRNLQNCASALEAELTASNEGLKLTLCWSSEPIDLEMDCVMVVCMIMSKENNHSSLVHLIRDIKACFGERDIAIKQIDRSQNEAGHIMAKMIREGKVTQFWFRNFPEVLTDVGAR
jgi:ribonuclease HI